MGKRIAWGLICLCLLTGIAWAQTERCTTETLQGRFVFTGRTLLSLESPASNEFTTGSSFLMGRDSSRGSNHPAGAARLAARSCKGPTRSMQIARER